MTVLSLLGITLISCGFAQPNRADVDATVAAAVQGTTQAEAVMKATIDAAIVATQQAQAVQPVQNASANNATSSSTSNNEVPPVNQQEISMVIADEVKGITEKDLSRLKLLYAPQATIIDRASTPQDTSDDVIWNGWDEIEQRYLDIFAIPMSALTMMNLSTRVEGNRGLATYDGIIIDGTLYEDTGTYTLENINGRWVITQQELGFQPSYAFQLPRDDGLYDLQVGSQHRYEEPWGWDKGDPCKAWREKDFDDTKPNHRGFNVELLLTNNSDVKAPDIWPISFVTSKGRPVKACHYAYDGSGPEPKVTTSLTFFTVVEKGEFVEKITLNLNSQVVRLCLDGRGGAWRCEEGR